MGELSRMGMHIQVKTPDHLSVVEHVPGFYCRVPSRRVCFFLKNHMEKLCSGIQNSFLHLRVWQVGTNGLRIETILRAPQLLLVVARFVIEDFLGFWMSLLLFCQQHGIFTRRSCARS